MVMSHACTTFESEFHFIFRIAALCFCYCQLVIMEHKYTTSMKQIISVFEH